MTETKPTLEALREEIVTDLVHVAGPCIILLFPPYRPGEPSEPTATRLKSGLRGAAKELAERKIAEPLIAELLEPLRQLSHQVDSLAGSASSRVIFRSRGLFRQLELPVSGSRLNACMVGDCFWIRPLLASLALPVERQNCCANTTRTNKLFPPRSVLRDVQKKRRGRGAHGHAYQQIVRAVLRSARSQKETHNR